MSSFVLSVIMYFFQYDQNRISELEDELRNNQENLLQTRESFMVRLKADLRT